MPYGLFLTFILELTYIGASLIFQSPSLTVDKGTNVTLLCDISQAFGQCSSVRWLQYQPERGLVVYNRFNRGFRTIVSKSKQDTQCLLYIPHAKLPDTGTFYCLLLNVGLDYMGNGTILKVMDTTNEMEVNNNNHQNSAVKELQCLIPLAVFGGVLFFLIILIVVAICIWQRRGVIMHKRKRRQLEEDSSSKTHYASLRFEMGRPDRVTQS